MNVILALASALAFGSGMALQQRGAREIPFEQALRPSLLARLLLRRVWLAGITISGVGFLLQLVALRTGSLVLVQPIVTSALVVCLAATAWYDREPLGVRTWAAIVVVIVGVSAFLWLGTARSATVSTSTVSTPALLAASVAFALLVLGCANRARHGGGTLRAVAVGAAAGLGNAFVAVLARAGADRLHAGVRSVLLSPYPYSLAFVAVLTVLLVQAMYQAGRPTLSLPVATVTEACASLGLAVVVLHEHPTLTGARGALAVLSFAAAVVALADLGRDEAGALEPAAVAGPRV